jgi:hypothetical protein
MLLQNAGYMLNGRVLPYAGTIEPGNNICLVVHALTSPKTSTTYQTRLFEDISNARETMQIVWMLNSPLSETVHSRWVHEEPQEKKAVDYLVKQISEIPTSQGDSFLISTHNDPTILVKGILARETLASVLANIHPKNVRLSGETYRPGEDYSSFGCINLVIGVLNKQKIPYQVGPYLDGNKAY